MRRRLSLLVIAVLAALVAGGAPIPPPAVAQEAADEAQPTRPIEEHEAARRDGGLDRTTLPDVPPQPSPPYAPNAGPLSPPTKPSSVDPAPNDVDLAVARARETGEPVEVESKRTETSITFANPDGTFTDELTAGPVRVRTEDGGWVPVDPTLVAGPGGVAPRAVPHEVVLSDGGDDEPLMTIEAPPEMDPEADDEPAEDPVGLSVDVESDTPLPTPRLEGAKATYPGAVAGADLVVTASTIGSEVSIVIPEPGEGQTSYDMPIEVDGLTAVQDETGGIELHEDGVVVGYSPAPIMFDDSGEVMPGVHERYGDVSSELVRQGDGYVLRVTPDPAYLADPATTYPVTIDPATDLYPSRDTFVNSSTPTVTNDSSTALYTGWNAFMGAARTFIRFDTTPIEGKHIVSGAVRVWQYASGTGCTATALNAYKTAALPAGATWNTQPAVTGGVRGTTNTAGDSTTCPTQTGLKSVDITSLVAEWAADANTHGTVGLRSSESTTGGQWKVFHSAETIGTPSLQVSYLTTPATPSVLRPTSGTTVHTLAPVLSAQANGGDGTTQYMYWSLRNASNVEIATNSVGVAPGARGSWTVPTQPSLVLQPGQSYTWTVKSCATSTALHCSATASSSFWVSEGLGAGVQPYFNFTGRGITDRSAAQVNVASGAMVLTATDLSVAGISGAATFARTYSSLGQGGDRMYGPRWSGTYVDTVRLEELSDGSFVFHGEQGETSLITKDSGGAYHPSADLDATFSDTGGYGVYVLRFNHDRGSRKAGESLYFYNSGVLENLLYGAINKNGQGPTLTYATGSTEVLGVVDTRNRDFVYDVDPSGNLVEIDDVTGDRQITFDYDVDGNLAEVIDAASGTTTYDYDASDNLTEITDPRGGSIRFVYDGQSRVTSMTREMGAVDETTTFAYTNPGLSTPGTTVVTDANGHATTYTWDKAYRITKATNALNQVVDTGYDINSNVTSVTHTGAVTSYTWDTARNNLGASSIPTGAKAEAGFPSSGSGLAPYKATSTTDAQQNQTDFTYDGFGNLTGATNDRPTQNSGTMTVEVYARTVCGAYQGQICDSTDARGYLTDLDYDSLGHVTNIDPQGSNLGQNSFTYDALSRVETVTDGKGTTRTYTYDEMDRVSSVEFEGGEFHGFGYDDNGNLNYRFEFAGEWIMTYDGSNRLLTQSGIEDVVNTYDKVGNLLTITDSTGTTEYEFTDINEVEVVRDDLGVETTFTYDANHGSWRTGIDHDSGVDVDIAHDSAGRITRVTSRDSATNIINDDTYTFMESGNPNPNSDAALRQTWTDKNGKVTTYGYDALNELTSVTTKLGGVSVNPSYAYTYDGNGNRLTAVKNGTTRTWTYNDADQISGATHDLNGNMLTSTYGLDAMSYNEMDQTASLTLDGGSAQPQTYSGISQVHWLSSGGTEFETALSLGISSVDDGTASAITREPDGALVSMRRSGERYDFVFDGRGSVIALTGDDGLVKNTYAYGPYGEPDSVTGSVPNPWRWNGGYTLDGTVYKFGARFYDTRIGRWTQIDPMPGEPRYAFAGNDPINKSDPTGADPSTDDLIDAMQFAFDVIGIAFPGLGAAIDGFNLGVDLVQAWFSDCPVEEALFAIGEYIVGQVGGKVIEEAVEAADIGVEGVDEAIEAVVGYALDQLGYEC